ncbi:MAG: acyl-CoA thioesterase [Anaerolineae bacterium]|nr:acyl-CoA thioesterase [Anaerolineae bacterium]
MPLIHKRTFRVRSYECDAYGHVNNANYLRYMQEAALDASAAVGYDEARYNEMGHIWLIRETNIEYLRPLRFGDSVEVTTWVGDFRRVRSRRMYELHSVSSGELVAKASTDWVYIERASGRPARVPDEMIAAFLPDGQPEEAQRRDPFPEMPTPPPGVVTVRRDVEWRDVDPEQHVNNAAYLNYMEECGLKAALSFGWSHHRMQSAGFAIVARQLRVEYRQPATFGDTLIVSTFLSDLRRATTVRHYRITRERDGEQVARARTLWVFVNLNTGGIMRLPSEFLDDFSSHVAQT